MSKKSKFTVTTALAALAMTVAGVTMAGPAFASENRYYGAKTCEGNVASSMKVNAPTNYVDVEKAGSNPASQTVNIFDGVWRSFTFYSKVKSSTSQHQYTDNFFQQASIFCDN
jgi:hypothetical protein